MKEIEKYQKEDGSEPFTDWRQGLSDEVQHRIFAYIRRVAQGGAKKNVKVLRNGEGVKEIKIHFGPAYRIYFGEVQNKIILLLMGGTKRTQKKDIEKAKEYWRDYNEKTKII